MKQVVKKFLLLLLVQLLIVFVFVRFIRNSQPIDINDTKQVDIVVDDMYRIRFARENWLAVVADSTEYIFKTRATFEDDSVHELYNAISKGDRLSLIYYETNRILFFQKANVIVDARTETEVYRTFEEFNRGREGVPIFVVVLFSIIESIFVGVVLFNVWLDYKTIRSVYRNARKRRLKRKNNRT